MAVIVTKIASYLKNDESLSNYFKRFVYNYRYKPYSQITSIKDIENCKENIVKKLLNKNIFKNQLPKSLNREEHCIDIATPEIAIYQFNNACIDVKSSSILIKNELITYRTISERFNEGFVKVHNNKHAKVETKQVEKLDKGFFLGGNGSWNWFHFLIEIMPKLILFDQKYSQTLFVNEIILTIPSMKKILEIVSENNFTVKYLSSEKVYFVEKLYFINDFNHLQFNRFDNHIKAEGTFFNPEITCDFSNLVLKKLSVKDNLPERIFLYRKNTHRIAKNQDQILKFLTELGFVPICLEELSIDEQASYFKTAKFIIGISGAAWSNLIFCRNQPKAICFVPENAEEFTAFSNLAKIFGADFYIQPYLNDGNHANSNFIINFEKFVELFNYVNEK
jgi:hypothetical protein